MAGVVFGCFWASTRGAEAALPALLAAAWRIAVRAVAAMSQLTLQINCKGGWQ